MTGGFFGDFDLTEMAWLGVSGVLGIFEGHSLPLIPSLPLLSSPSSYFFLSINKEEKDPKSRNGLTMRFYRSQNPPKTPQESPKNSRSFSIEEMPNECF